MDESDESKETSSESSTTDLDDEESEEKKKQKKEGEDATPSSTSPSQPMPEPAESTIELAESSTPEPPATEPQHADEDAKEAGEIETIEDEEQPSEVPTAEPMEEPLQEPGLTEKPEEPESILEPETKPEPETEVEKTEEQESKEVEQDSVEVGISTEVAPSSEPAPVEEVLDSSTPTLTEAPSESLSTESVATTPTGGETQTFLELDKETQERMVEIEAAELEAVKTEEDEPTEVGIFAVKTSIGHEKMVANWLAMRARKRKIGVYAILSPPKLRGYLLLESVKNYEALQDMIKGVQHARSVVEGNTSLDEIEHFLTPKPLVSGIEEGDVVEIIAGPFKGEKAKVTQIDEAKEEITVELFEAMVSIPVTIRGDHVRILEKEAK